MASEDHRWSWSDSTYALQKIGEQLCAEVPLTFSINAAALDILRVLTSEHPAEGD
jgi:hypothetical protein